MKVVLGACFAICASFPAASSAAPPAQDPVPVLEAAQPAEATAIPVHPDLDVPHYPGAKFLGINDPGTGTSQLVFSTSDPKEKVTAFYVENTGALLQTGLSGPRQDFLSDHGGKSRKGTRKILVQPRKSITYIYIDRYRR